MYNYNFICLFIGKRYKNHWNFLGNFYFKTLSKVSISTPLNSKAAGLSLEKEYSDEDFCQVI